MLVLTVGWPTFGWAADEFAPITDKDVDRLMKFWESAAQVLKSDPALRKRLDERGDREETAKSTREGERQLMRMVLEEPKLKKLLADAGIKPERFGPIMFSFGAASLSVTMKRAGQLKEYPPELKQQAQLVEKRYRDVEKFSATMKEIEKLDSPTKDEEPPP